MSGRRQREQLTKQGRMNSRLELVIQRMTQSADGGSEKMEVGQRRESQKSERRLLRPVDPQRSG